MCQDIIKNSVFLPFGAKCIVAEFRAIKATDVGF
jgi:hypothetical protein